MLLQNRIGAERAHFGFTQRELAARIHEPLEKVRELEETGNGEVLVLVKIAAFFRVTVDYLLGLDAQPYPGQLAALHTIPPAVEVPQPLQKPATQGVRKRKAPVAVEAEAPQAEVPKKAIVKAAQKNKKVPPWQKGFLGSLAVPARTKKALYDSGVKTEAKFYASSAAGIRKTYGIGEGPANTLVAMIDNKRMADEAAEVE